MTARAAQSFALALAAALCIPASAAGQVIPVQVLRVIDGDTVVVDAYPWPAVTIRTAVRLAGIDTPELRGRCDEERERAREALATVVDLVRRAQTVVIVGPVHGQFAARVVAQVLVDGVNLTETLMAAGLGRAYDGRSPRQPWCGDDIDRPNEADP